MIELNAEQIRNFRLHTHHLAAASLPIPQDIIEIAGACGLQNSPPGAWETALFNRIPQCGLPEMERLLYKEKSLLQAWSLRGAPIVFPAAESGVFLSALIPQEDEPWIYTKGIGLALDFLQMDFEELFELLRQILPQLDRHVLVSKTALDQTLAQWMLPLLPAAKRDLWNQPSMYGHPEVQTVGGAAVSFMLRPCAFLGLVVFGERNGASPAFTSYKRWTGHAAVVRDDDAKQLVRKYLHCYGPSTASAFTAWLGCSGKQGRRLWNALSEEMEPAEILGKRAYILASDKERLLSPAPLQRELLLLGGHDPFLDQRDRIILQPDQSLHKLIWKTVSNPGAVLYRGEIIGIWTSKKNNRGMEIKITLWSQPPDLQKLRDLAGEYAAFRQLELTGIDINKGSNQKGIMLT